MTLGQRVAAVVLGVALACTNPTTVCGCTPPVNSGVVYGIVSQAGSPAAGAVVEVEIFRERCDAGQPLYRMDEGLEPSDGAGRYRAQVAIFEPVDAACVRVIAFAAAGAATGTGGPLRIRASNPPDSVRVDVVIP